MTFITGKWVARGPQLRSLLRIAASLILARQGWNDSLDKLAAALK
jgi:hypothetical protein